MDKTKSITLKRKVAGRTLSAIVSGTWNEDAEDYVTPASELEAAELAMAAELALAGPVSGDAFRFMRGALGMQSKVLAALLGVVPETVSRWETEAREVDRAAWLVLGGLVLERAGKAPKLLERMERIARP